MFSKKCPQCDKTFYQTTRSGLARVTTCSRRCGANYYAKPLKARFEAIAGERPTTGCWVWGGTKKTGGYGVMSHRGKHHSAHRLAYLIYKGVDPRDQHVCHTCDNPSCVNPAHLWLGTHQDNMADRKAKGRGRTPQGVEHWKAKLTEAQVKAIRAEGARGLKSFTALAHEFGVSRTTISNIIRRKMWDHI